MKQGKLALAKLRGVRDSGLSLSQFAICVSIILRENSSTGYTYASTRTLARDAKIVVRTAYQNLSILERSGIVRVQRRRGKSSLRSVNLSALQSLQEGREVMASERLHQTPAIDAVVPQPLAEEQPSHELGACADLHLMQPNSPFELPSELPSSRVKRTSRKTNAPFNGKAGVDDSVENIAERLIQEFQDTSPRRLQWTVRLVLSRAKARPRTLHYFRKSLPGILQQLSAEVQAWLTKEAMRHLRESGVSFRLGDLAEHLKLAAASNDLPYSGESVGAAIDSAQRQLEEEQHLRSALVVGRLPMVHGDYARKGFV